VEVAVVATEKLSRLLLSSLTALGLLLASLLATCTAAVLPEDRLDLLYHAYDGGGAQIQGPSLLIRKSFSNKVSVRANYYVDMVSSASIDVQATASPYAEERVETSLGVDYLLDSTNLSLGITNSEESDYTARSLGLSISQSLFGDLTTVTMSASAGEDTVSRNGDTSFSDGVSRRRLGVNIAQVLTKNLIVAANAETVIDQGFLNNPYRSVRFVDPASAQGYSYAAEVYPRTRNSDALALRAMYYLPWRVSLRGEYRYYSDSWAITASNVEVKYIQPVPRLLEGLTIELKLRGYDQTAAEFYNDLFPYRNAQTFLARDKELSDFQSRSFGIGLAYEFKPPVSMLQKSSINLYWDHMQFRYNNFLDVTRGGPAGAEPAYGFNANVVRLFLSVWY
jgi:hypothetical protein